MMIFIMYCPFIDATGLSQKNRDFETEILAEIISLPFPIEKRAELGRHLGIPTIKLHQIEQLALDNLYPKETALKEMIYLWFDREKSASYAKIMGIIYEKMENHTDYAAAYGKSVMQGDTQVWGCCVTEADIQKILDHILTPATRPRIAEANVAQIFNVQETRDEPHLDRRLQLILNSWLLQERDNATWKNLVRNTKAVDQDAASRIEELRHGDFNESIATPDQIRPRGSSILVCIIVAMHALLK